MQSTAPNNIEDVTRGGFLPSTTKSWDKIMEEKAALFHHHDDIESLVSLLLLRIEHHKFEMMIMHADLRQEMCELSSDLLMYYHRLSAEIQR